MRVHHRLWRIVKTGAPILVGLATIGSLIVAWLQLQEQLRQIEAQTRRPPTFQARLDNPTATQRLVTFASDNDYQVRRIDLECLLDEGERSCVWAEVGEKTETVLFITTHLLHGRRTAIVRPHPPQVHKVILLRPPVGMRNMAQSSSCKCGRE